MQRPPSGSWLAALRVLLVLAVVAVPAAAGAAGSQSRSYITGAGSTLTGPTNCHQQHAALPAVDAACFELAWASEETVTVTVEDQRDQVVLARAVFLDSGGNHLGSWLFCGSDRFEIPIYSTTLQVWVQPAWAGALNTAEEVLSANDYACEPVFGTTGTVTATIG